MYIPDLYFGPLPHFHRKKIKTLIYGPNAGQGHCPRYGDAVTDQIIEQSTPIKRLVWGAFSPSSWIYALFIV